MPREPRPRSSPNTEPPCARSRGAPALPRSRAGGGSQILDLHVPGVLQIHQDNDGLPVELRHGDELRPRRGLVAPRGGRPIVLRPLVAPGEQHVGHLADHQRVLALERRHRQRVRRRRRQVHGLQAEPQRVQGPPAAGAAQHVLHRLPGVAEHGEVGALQRRAVGVADASEPAAAGLPGLAEEAGVQRHLRQAQVRRVRAPGHHVHLGRGRQPSVERVRLGEVVP
mmetsp:Transcript_109687/g.306721  ORF Transcript_109687/g.306721 Transcript_109687/m.306721 type:complete len:225 (+) Transcript_109687:155-829(+)